MWWVIGYGVWCFAIGALCMFVVTSIFADAKETNREETHQEDLRGL